MVNFGNEWDVLLEDEMQKAYYQQLRQFLKQEYSTQTIYPDMYDIFNALKLASYSQVRVVILGQDPYHGPNQAHGLSFSVRKGVAVPKSLINIYKEIHADLGIDNLNKPDRHGELTCWAKQGVLLLNTVLTVRAHQANSHRGQGWEIFTDEIIRLLNIREDPIVFLLWGTPARKKKELITNPKHLILEAAHPSPLSASKGFFGCRHFSQTNQFLENHGFAPIDWTVY